MIKHLITGQLIFIAVALIVIFAVLPLLLHASGPTAAGHTASTAGYTASTAGHAVAQEMALQDAAMMSLPALIVWAFW